MMPRIPCIKGCIYFAGLDKSNKPICTRVPTPLGDIEADTGCWWGKRAETKRRTKNDDKSQSTLF